MQSSADPGKTFFIRPAISPADVNVADYASVKRCR
jgi:hypothetical protein